MITTRPIFILFVLLPVVVSAACQGEQQEPLDGSGGGIIAFTAGSWENLDIYLSNADGTARTKVTHDGQNSGWPVWSPDGLHLAFISNRSGLFEIYVMDVLDIARGAFSEPRRITDGPAAKYNPSWSPDGNRIAFCATVEGSSRGALFIVDLTDGQIQQVTDEEVDAFHPAWRPGSEQIAFTRTSGGEQDIYVINTDGTGLALLYGPGGNQFAPSWSRDGSLLAFNSDEVDNNLDVWIISADGSHPRRLTTAPGNDEFASFSPDGSQLVYEYENYRDGEELYRSSLNGADPPQRVTRNNVLDMEPDWRP